MDGSLCNATIDPYKERWIIMLAIKHRYLERYYMYLKIIWPELIFHSHDVVVAVVIAAEKDKKMENKSCLYLRFQRLFYGMYYFDSGQ